LQLDTNRTIHSFYDIYRVSCYRVSFIIEMIALLCVA